MDQPERNDVVGATGPAAFAGRAAVLVGFALLVVVAATVGLGAVAFGGQGPAVDAPAATETAVDAASADGDPSVPTADGVGESLAEPDGPRPATTGSSGSSGASGAGSSDVNTTLIEREIHERVNEIRRNRSLPPLSYSEDLAEIAAYYSGEMAAEEFFAHTAPDGQTLLDRYERFGYDCRIETGESRPVTGGENLAYTYAYAPVETEVGVVSYGGNETRIARGIVRGWMHSPGHRENLLRPYWEREGVGAVLDPEGGRTQVVVTQNFC